MNPSCFQGCFARVARTLLSLSIVAPFTANVAHGFSISAVTLSPSNVVPPMTELRMTIDITTPSQGTWLYAPTQISSNATGLRVDVYPTSGMLTAIGSLRETVTLGVFSPGTHNYEVVIHPNFQVNWGTRTNRGSFTVTGEPPPTVVSIEATQPIAEETSAPLRRMNLVGVFTISRTGPTNHSLPVFVHYSGTATPGVDYPYLPWFVTIPAGASSTEIRVEAIPDSAPEGIETLVATLSHCPPETEPPLGMPCFAGFEIDPVRGHATVFVRDDGITQASLAITNPPDGAKFAVGETILIEAVAIDLEGYISRVEFWDGETRIGVSEITFIRAPDPGTPIPHSFEWTGAAPGAHVLTARAADFHGNALTSAPVRITVGPVSNEAPRVSITRPANGAEFPPDTAIEIVAETRDPDGYVRKMEFFADGRKIGESSVEFIRPPDPGQTQTFTFTWRQPPPGTHALTARATDNGGATGTSAPVEIRVAASEPIPIVTVSSPDSFATEPRSNSVLNTATFRVRRHGPTNTALVVAYSLHGTATNGIDYETLSGQATIPAGSRSVTLTVRPLADNLPEGTETVRLRLEESPFMGPMIQYRIGRPYTAVAVISDGPWWPSPREMHCIALPGGLRHVCFAAESGHNFRIEASSDLRNWETLFAAMSSEGAWHFIDIEDQPRRFYRLTPEPVEESYE
jgi:hypothetical protein